MMRTEPVEVHMDEANGKAAPAAGRNPFGQLQLAIE